MTNLERSLERGFQAQDFGAMGGFAIGRKLAEAIAARANELSVPQVQALKEADEVMEKILGEVHADGADWSIAASWREDQERRFAKFGEDAEDIRTARKALKEDTVPIEQVRPKEGE